MDLVGAAQSNAAKNAVLQQTILEKAYYKTDVRGACAGVFVASGHCVRVQFLGAICAIVATRDGCLRKGEVCQLPSTVTTGLWGVQIGWVIRTQRLAAVAWLPAGIEACLGQAVLGVLVCMLNHMQGGKV